MLQKNWRRMILDKQVDRRSQAEQRYCSWSAKSWKAKGVANKFTSSQKVKTRLASQSSIYYFSLLVFHTVEHLTSVYYRFITNVIKKKKEMEPSSFAGYGRYVGFSWLSVDCDVNSATLGCLSFLGSRRGHELTFTAEWTWIQYEKRVRASTT